MFVALCAAPVASGLNGRIEATTAWVENINRTSNPPDAREALRFETRGTLSAFREWRTGLLTTGEIDAGIEHVPDFDELDAATAGASGTIRQKFGLGAFAPSLAFDAGLHARDTRLDFDDGWVATAAVRIGKRMTPSWRAALHGDWQQHYARSAMFDTRHHRFFATVTWDITDWLQLSHGHGRLRGTFTANASAAIWPRAIGGEFGSHISNYYKSVPWAATGAFGPGWISYRVHGHVTFYWFELSPALGRNTSLPLRFENRTSVNRVGVKYRQDVWSLSLLHRF